MALTTGYCLFHTMFRGRAFHYGASLGDDVRYEPSQKGVLFLRWHSKPGHAEKSGDYDILQQLMVEG